jgi:hypothetical protein
MKTAAFTENRRIGVAFLASRRDDKDQGQRIYGGNAIIREIFQHEDGSLGTKFPKEMVPAHGKTLDLPIAALTNGISASTDSVHIKAFEGLEAAVVENVPRNVHITLNVKPKEKSVN